MSERTPRPEVYRQLLELKAGWLDGECEPISQRNIDRLESIIQHLAAAGIKGEPYVYPSEDAGVHAEYDEEGVDVEVTNKRADVCFLRGGPGLWLKVERIGEEAAP